MERPAKLQRLENLRRGSPFVSQSALESILDNVRKEGVPNQSSRKLIKKATKAALSENTSYGPLLLGQEAITKEGEKVKFEITNLATYLHLLYAQMGSFHQLLNKTHRDQPSSVDDCWSLMLYGDEIVPGNVLGKAQRKGWSIFCSFLQFPLQALCNEKSWLTLCHVRSSLVNSLEGGIGQVMSIILQSIFVQQHFSPGLGVLLSSEAGNVGLFFKLGVFIQDGSSHKYCFSSKGDSGLKYCLLCNVTASKVSDEEDPESAELSRALKYNQLRVYSDEEILGTFDRLEQRKAVLSNADFGLWQKAVGVTYNTQMLLLNAELRAASVLRPATQYCHDYMHGCLSNGTLGVSVFLLFSALPGDAWALFHKCLECWNFPACLNCKHISDLFNEKSVKKYKKAAKFTCEASELLSLLPVLVHWVFQMLQRDIEPVACKAFLGQAYVVALLTEGQLLGLTTPTRLLAAIERSFELFHSAV